MILSAGPAKKMTVKGENEATWSDTPGKILYITITNQNTRLTCKMETASGATTGYYQETQRQGSQRH